MLLMLILKIHHNMVIWMMSLRCKLLPKRVLQSGVNLVNIGARDESFLPNLKSWKIGLVRVSLDYVSLVVLKNMSDALH